MKILYVTTIGGTMGFFGNYIKSLLDGGNTVDIASNIDESNVPEYYRNWGCRIYRLPCSRTPFSRGNIAAIKKLRQLAETRRYDIVHCHTPVAAFCTRVACIGARRQGTKVFYTAHGFHFYAGAPLKNWLAYYPVEWLCSWWTDVLIAINQEDYKRAKKYFHAKKVAYVPGIGVELQKFQSGGCGRNQVRTELGLKDTDIMLLSVGELNENKNHTVMVEALGMMKKERPDIYENIYYFVAGEGKNRAVMEELAQRRGVREHLRLLGFIENVPEVLSASDIFLLPSKREGLNVSLMEAMAGGLPCIVSDIRGNRDLIRNRRGGRRVGSGDIRGWLDAVLELAQDGQGEGLYNMRVISGFSVERIKKKMNMIYDCMKKEQI